jgi:hypothetical protein
MKKHDTTKIITINAIIGFIVFLISRNMQRTSPFQIDDALFETEKSYYLSRGMSKTPNIPQTTGAKPWAPPRPAKGRAPWTPFYFLLSPL